MAEILMYDGVEKAGTFYLDTTTTTAISADPKQIVGKVVTVTGNDTVGYGTAGDPILGVVDPSVEPISTNDKKLLVCVRRFRMFEDISCAGTETAGTFLAVNGQGGVQASGTSSAPVYLGTVATSVNATAKTCTIWVI